MVKAGGEIDGAEYIGFSGADSLEEFIDAGNGVPVLKGVPIERPKVTDDAETPVVRFWNTKNRVVVRASGALDDAGFDPGGELVFDGSKMLGGQPELRNEDGLVSIKMDFMLKDVAAPNVVLVAAETVLIFVEKLQEAGTVMAGSVAMNVGCE